MQPQPKITEIEQQKLTQSITQIKQKMKLINYNNFEPPYFNHTLSKFRQTYFSRLVKDIKLEGENNVQIRDKLRTIRFIIEKFDDECFDIYAAQLIQPYVRKMFQDNYQFDGVQFKEINTHYNLQGEIQETLTQAAQWLAQIEVTQDLLSRIQLYFKLKTPNIIEKVRQEGLDSQKSTWTGSFLSGVSKLLSFGLRKGSKMVQSTFFTAVAPGALMLTLAVVGGTATLPWKTTLTTNNLITAAAIVAVPFILDSMADQVEKADYKAKLKRWALTFESLADSIRKFNDKLEQCIRDCTLSANLQEFLKQKTNLQKIVADLNKSLQSVTNFDEQKFAMMRERTEAYFRQYVEIKEDGWTLVVPKGEEINHERLLQKGSEIELLAKVQTKVQNQVQNKIQSEAQNKVESQVQSKVQNNVQNNVQVQVKQMMQSCSIAKENGVEEEQFVKL